MFDKCTHGGTREGAGRKPVENNDRKVPFPIRIAQWRVDKIDRILGVTGESRATLTEKALDSYCNMAPPK